MINEKEFNILFQEKYNNISLIQYIFGYSPLKTYLNNIYRITEFPIESFIIALFYFSRIKNKIRKNKLYNYLFTCIIIANKQLFDEIICVKKICSILNINFDKYLIIELDTLNKLDWNTFIDDYSINSFNTFKHKCIHFAVYNTEFTNLLLQMDLHYNHY